MAASGIAFIQPPQIDKCGMLNVVAEASDGRKWHSTYTVYSHHKLIPQPFEQKWPTAMSTEKASPQAGNGHVQYLVIISQAWSSSADMSAP